MEAVQLAEDAASSILSKDASSSLHSYNSRIEFGAKTAVAERIWLTVDADLEKSDPYLYHKPDGYYDEAYYDVSEESVQTSFTATDNVSSTNDLLRARIADLERQVADREFEIQRLKREKDGLRIVTQYISDNSVLQHQIEEREKSLHLATEALETHRQEKDATLADMRQQTIEITALKERLKAEGFEALRAREALLQKYDDACSQWYEGRRETTAKILSQIKVVEDQQSRIHEGLSNLLNSNSVYNDLDQFSRLTSVMSNITAHFASLKNTTCSALVDTIDASTNDLLMQMETILNGQASHDEAAKSFHRNTMSCIAAHTHATSLLQ